MDYSSLVKNVKNIFEYQNAMDGKKSKAMKANPPLGRRYFQNTGIKCNKSKEYQYFFMDAKPTENASIYDSAMRDFSSINPELNESPFLTCEKKQFTTVDVNGKKKKKKYSVSKEAFQNMDFGQKFFIGSLSILGLYLFYKALYKGKH